MPLETMTITQAGKSLRDMAELTAKMSKNWDNFEKIAADMLQQVYDAGKENPRD